MEAGLGGWGCEVPVVKQKYLALQLCKAGLHQELVLGLLLTTGKREKTYLSIRAESQVL